MGGGEQALRGQRREAEPGGPGCACWQTPDDLPGEHGERMMWILSECCPHGWCCSHDPGSHSRRIRPVIFPSSAAALTVHDPRFQVVYILVHPFCPPPKLLPSWVVLLTLPWGSLPPGATGCSPDLSELGRGIDNDIFVCIMVLSANGDVVPRRVW